MGFLLPCPLGPLREQRAIHARGTQLNYEPACSIAENGLFTGGNAVKVR